MNQEIIYQLIMIFYKQYILQDPVKYENIF